MTLSLPHISYFLIELNIAVAVTTKRPTVNKEKMQKVNILKYLLEGIMDFKSLETYALCRFNVALGTRDAKILQKPSLSPDLHRTKSAESSIEPGQHLSSTARSPAEYTVIASPKPGMSPALSVRVPQKARPGLNFEPGRVTGPERCISIGYMYQCRYVVPAHN